MASSPTNSTVEAGQKEQKKLIRMLQRLETQVAFNQREIDRLEALLQDKERHYLFHLSAVDRENRELSELVALYCKKAVKT
jgi:uncharacterized protein (DUF3084 family)